MSRFLVTGASGFIGSAIVRGLIAGGNEVVAPGRVQLDLLTASDSDLAQFVERSRVSHCIHAAWYTNHADYLTHPVNTEWTSASLRLARVFTGRFVGLGTCLEYDLSAREPCSEERTPLRPETLYARSKVKLFEALHCRGVDFAWARLFFVYGPGDRAGRLVPTILEQFARGERAGPTYGGLRRDYIHVDDLADQILRIANSDVRGAINTGTGQAPTLSEIYAAGAAAFGRPELAERSDEIGGQPMLIQSDLSRFRALIGDSQARSIGLGLKGLVG